MQNISLFDVYMFSFLIYTDVMYLLSFCCWLSCGEFVLLINPCGFFHLPFLFTSVNLYILKAPSLIKYITSLINCLHSGKNPQPAHLSVSLFLSRICSGSATEQTLWIGSLTGFREHSIAARLSYRFCYTGFIICDCDCKHCILPVRDLRCACDASWWRSVSFRACTYFIRTTTYEWPILTQLKHFVTVSKFVNTV